MTYWQEWGWLEWSAFVLATICGYAICVALVFALISLISLISRGGPGDDGN